MRITCVGGGPAGLYFSLLMKKQDPSHEITLLERNAPDVTFGWGVVFSDETLGNLLETDGPTHDAITKTFAHWDAIDIVAKGETIRSVGHGFSGIARSKLLSILQRRCVELGIDLRFGSEVNDLSALPPCDLLVGCDGIRSKVRESYAEQFGPSLDVRRSRYIWLGTSKRFDAFTFLFEENEHGLFQVHAYRFDAETSTFIVECDEATWRNAGLDRASIDESLRYLQRVFAGHLGGHGLRANNASWLQFVTVRNERWSHENKVLLGDAAHTAHFSIGSGTKLAIEDAIELADAFRAHPNDVKAALEAYETARRPVVERTQKAAQDSLRWFENTKRHYRLEPTQLAFSLLTRSKRISYEDLELRDPAYVEGVTAWLAKTAGAAKTTPPMFTKFKLRELSLTNRVVVSPMCMYSATDGEVNDFHLVHLGSRALGGAGLVVTEMTNVSPEGRITPGCAGMYAPRHVAAWKRIVDFVHERSSAKLCMQLAHAGRKGSQKRPWEGTNEPLVEGSWRLLAPSPIPYGAHNQVPREMTRRDMDEVRAAFVRSARLAEDAGFDMLELHFAHGYLLSSFLSPLTNHRSDAYGGTPENRRRFPIEIFNAVRAVWPAHKPMSVRVSAVDWAPGGLESAETVETARVLAAHGCDIIDVSTGQNVPDQRPQYGRMWQTRFADQVRGEAQIATMAVGAITSADQINTIIASGRADLCVLARPHLLDPHFTLRAAVEQNYCEGPWPDPYATVRPRRPA